MSPNCKHTNGEQQFPCPCDSFEHPPKLNIGMGLTDLPRQIAGFPEFRRAMLFSFRPKDAADINKLSLNGWKARQQDDPGVMLLEMWAYICDSLSFYDKVIAQEEYIRTAVRRPSLRKLVALLGYLPGPAVGATVYLTALAEGRLKLLIPEGTAFRSAGFDGNPPQVFELDKITFIHPLTSRWSLKAPQPDFIQYANPAYVLIVPKTEIKTGIPLLLIDSENNLHTQAVWVSTVEPYTGADGIQYRKIKFGSPAKLPAHNPLQNLQLNMPLQSVGLWTMAVADTPPSISDKDNSIVLDGLYRQIKTGQYILISRNALCRWYQVKSVSEISRRQTAGDKIIINSSQFDIPGISVSVTKLILDQPLNKKNYSYSINTDWTDSDKAELIVHFMMQVPGSIVNEHKTTVAFDDLLLFKEKAEKPIDNYDPSTFFLTDKNTRGVKLNGMLDYNTSSLIPAMNEQLSPELTLPVDVFGNILKASRGETVPREIAGSGDATIINQTFKLKKKPLTYFPAPTVADDQGLKNTLRIYVNGIRWTEVRSFFNKQEKDEIYIVRQNDEGDSFVTFGDGIRGRRLPTGTDNIVVTYRYGAGQAAPPAGTITQISKPVKGLTSINNPLAASGGADAETAENLKAAAPKSILTLGRIVSIPDVEAVALSVAGVRGVQVEWRWNGEKQSPVVHIWYIGEAGVEEVLRTRLRSLSDPSMIIYAEMATAIPSSLTIDILSDPRFVREDIIKEVRDAFTDSKTGLLVPQNMGIGKPLFRSKIFAVALAIPGVLAVNNILFNGEIFSAFAKSPGAGKYFDFENGSLLLNINN